MNNLFLFLLPFSLWAQLGLNDTKDRGDNDGDVGDLLPSVNLGTGLQAVDVTAGLRHTAAILNDGSVRGWGYNGKGQLGIGNIRNVGDELDEMGSSMSVTYLGNVKPTSISAGGWHTCVITDDSRLKCWGEGRRFYVLICMANDEKVRLLLEPCAFRLVIYIHDST